MEQVVDRESNNAAISQTTAIRFLMARKFDVNRALALYTQHQVRVMQASQRYDARVRLCCSLSKRDLGFLLSMELVCRLAFFNNEL